MRLFYDIIVGIVTNVAGGYIIAAVQKLFADRKEDDALPTKKKHRK